MSKLNNLLTKILLTGLFLLIALPVLGEDYQIGAGDVLTITVFDHDELATKDRVSDNGNITFPLIGEVHVGGMKLSEAAQAITALLADGYIINPQVSIFIDEFTSKKVIILGQIKQTGVIKLQGPTSLLELITQAGGLKENAGETATIKRTVDGSQKSITVNLDALIKKGDATQNVSIKGGDTVSISKGAICYITGEVKNPGSYPNSKGTTVLNIVSLAGGFTGIAAESSVKIIRMIDGQKKTLKSVDLNTPVLPDDIITVPESFF
jgi:polysaccharide export outer membrane protein